MRFIIIICFALLFISAPVNANERVLGLEIEVFFNKIEELYNQKKPDADKLLELKAYYTSEDYVATHEATSNLGEKVIKTKQNRQEFLASLENPTSELLNSSISHTITDIRYFDDKISAEVDYTSLLKGDIKTEKEDMGMVIIKFISLSTCTESLRLENEFIKSFGSDCKTETIYGKPQPLE